MLTSDDGLASSHKACPRVGVQEAFQSCVHDEGFTADAVSRSLSDGMHTD